MYLIHCTTFIEASAERVFDLSRSHVLQKQALKDYHEEAIKISQNGLMNDGDSVTWKGRHLWRNRMRTMHIKEYKRPDIFIEEQEEGSLRLLRHAHYFKQVQNGTLMIDRLQYEPRYGRLGQLLHIVYLKSYLTRLLQARNSLIKKVAESGQWKVYLNP